MKYRKILPLMLAFATLFSTSIGSAFADILNVGQASEIINDMEVDAEAAMLIDMDDDTILYDMNGDEQICPASITKVMTALIVFEHIENGDYQLTDKVTAYDDCWNDLDTTSSNQNIRPGEKMTIDDLLYCMLVASANEAANILAERTSGSIDTFVKEMNSRARQLGCKNTNFINPHGMPDDNHYSSCYDLYLIAKEAMGYSHFREIVATAEHYVDKTNKSAKRHFFNTNALLSNFKYTGYVYEPCIGIKTGTTDKGGYNLLSAAESNGETLISVVIGCQPEKNKDGTINYKHFSESSRLLQWGFDNFKEVEIVSTKDTYGEVAVELSADADSVALSPAKNVKTILPKDITKDSFEEKVVTERSVEAPVKAGDVLGSLTLILDGEEYTTVNLVAVTDVQASDLLKKQAMLMEFLSHWYVKIGLVIIAILIAILLFKLLVLRSDRNYSGYSNGRKYRSKKYSRNLGGGYRGRGRRRR